MERGATDIDQAPAVTAPTPPVGIDTPHVAGSRLQQALQVAQGVTTQPNRTAAAEAPTPHEVTDPVDQTMDKRLAMSAPTPGPAEAPNEGDDVVVDLRDVDHSRVDHSTGARHTAEPADVTVSVGVDAELEWGTATQGWVRDELGRVEWRVIVTSASELEAWEVATPLGLITVDAVLQVPTLEPSALRTSALASSLAETRARATAELTAETVRRGGHGVLNVESHVTQLRGTVLITVTGDAVTLRSRPD